MDYNKIIKDVAGALTRLQMTTFNFGDAGLISQTIGKLCKDNKSLLDDNKKLSEQLDNREEDVSTEDLKEVLNYIRLQRNQAPDVYYKISMVIRERESLSPKDMTVEEIQEELGYAIKVVGERV